MKIYKLILVLYILSTSSATFGQRSNPDIVNHIDSLVNIFRDNTNSAVIVGVVTMPQGGSPEILKLKYGHLTRDTNSSPPVNDSTLFQIGSITKTFTTTILSMLVNNGTISLFDTVQKFLPDSVRAPVYVNPNTNDTTVIRFIDLATHYSGLPDEPHIGSGGMTTYKQMFDFLATYQLTYPPGECFYYSDLGIALLGVSIQHILQDSIELLIPELVCDTLGMYDSRIINLSQSQLSRRALGYSLAGHPASYILPNWPAYHGAGGLYSTLNDMTKYLQFVMRISNVGLGNILDTLMKERRVSNDSCQNPTSIDSVGLAWQFGKLFPNNPKNHIRSIFKDGSTSGFCSYICFSTHPVSNLKTGVVIVTNWKNPGPLEEMSLNILRFLNEQAINNVESNSSITGYRLSQNFPNPFNPSTTIRFTIPKTEIVSLKVFDALGNEVAELMNSRQSSGEYNIEWDGSNFASGIYYYKLTAGSFEETRKMILIK